MSMRTIDLEGIPEEQAKAIEEQVRYWREQAAKRAKPAVEIPRWKGKVIGRMTREEIYDDDE